MPPFTVLRIQKLKTWGAIAGAAKHNQRERETPNADEGKRDANRQLMGDPEKDTISATKELIGGQRIRSNAVLGVELLLSASPEYFRPNAPERAGEHDASRLDSWVNASTDWLQQRYGSRVVKAVLHLDESTPHIHALMVPLDDRGKLNCRALFGGTRHTLSQLQTDYAEAVSDLGIQRGIQNSRATHQQVSRYYTLTQGTEVTLPAPEHYTAPELPNKLARMSDERLAAFSRDAARSGVNAQRAAAEPIIAALQSENTRLKQQAEQVKRSNSLLAQANSALRQQLNHVRALDLGSVLRKLCRLQGPVRTEGAYTHFTLDDKRTVRVMDRHWLIDDAKKGKGAVDMLMAVRGYEQRDLHKAVGELAAAFGSDKAVGELATQAIDEAKTTVRVAERKREHKEAMERKQREARTAQSIAEALRYQQTSERHKTVADIAGHSESPERAQESERNKGRGR